MEQWDNLLEELGLEKSLASTESSIIINEFKLHGNEFAYEELLRIPCFYLSKYQKRRGEWYINGWFAGITLACAARIVYPYKVSNYCSVGSGKRRFLRDYCKIVEEGKESKTNLIFFDDALKDQLNELLNKYRTIGAWETEIEKSERLNKEKQAKIEAELKWKRYVAECERRNK